MSKENTNVKWYEGERVVVWRVRGDGIAQSAGHGVISGTKRIEVSGKWHKVPHIKLDNGGSIFGYECWWVSEKGYKRLEKDISK